MICRWTWVARAMVVVGLLVVGRSLDAQTASAAGQATQAVPKPGDIELGFSRVYVRVDKARIGHDHAIVGKLQASWLKLTPQAAGESQGKMVFDMRSFDADSDAARQYIGLEGSTDASTRKQVNDNMLGKEVLDVQKYPTATFIATKVTKLDAASKRGLPQYEVEGDFTLHGTTKPVKFTIDVELVNGWQRVRGAFSILQSQFGIKPFSKMFGAIGVADKLDIYGDLFVAP